MQSCTVGGGVVSGLATQQVRYEVQEERGESGYVGRRGRGAEEGGAEPAGAGNGDAVYGRHVGFDGVVVGRTAAAEGLDVVGAGVAREYGAGRDHPAAGVALRRNAASERVVVEDGPVRTRSSRSKYEHVEGLGRRVPEVLDQDVVEPEPTRGVREGDDLHRPPGDSRIVIDAEGDYGIGVIENVQVVVRSRRAEDIVPGQKYRNSPSWPQPHHVRGSRTKIEAVGGIVG